MKKKFEKTFDSGLRHSVVSFSLFRGTDIGFRHCGGIRPFSPEDELAALAAVL